MPGASGRPVETAAERWESRAMMDCEVGVRGAMRRERSRCQVEVEEVWKYWAPRPSTSQAWVA